MEKKNTNINYKGKTLQELYALSLIGAEFCTEKNEDGITVVDSIKKQLYTKTVLLARLLGTFELPEDTVMSIEQFNNTSDHIPNITGKIRLKTDYELFIDMLNTEIQNKLGIENDIMKRFNDEIKMSTSPENLERLTAMKDDILNKLDEIKK